MTEFFRKISKAEIRNILAIIITLGVFIMMYLIIIKPIPAENKDVVNIAVGFIFGGGLGGVVGYYFGASKGVTEPKKDDE